MKTRDIDPFRYSVNAWNKLHEQLEHDLVHKTLAEAKDYARRLWRKHKGNYRVSVFDEGTNSYVFHIEAGPMKPQYGLPCNDPEHQPPSPWDGRERRGRRRR